MSLGHLGYHSFHWKIDAGCVCHIPNLHCGRRGQGYQEFYGTNVKRVSQATLGHLVEWLMTAYDSYFWEHLRQRCGKFVASGTVIYASGTSMAGAEFANLMNSFYPLLRVQEILKFCPIGRRWDGGYAMVSKASESRHGRAITAKKMVGKLCLLCDERCNCNCVNIGIITTTVRVITLPSCCDHVAITLPRRYKPVNIMQLFSS